MRKVKHKKHNQVSGQEIIISTPVKSEVESDEKSQNSCQLTEKAIIFAMNAHKGQVRKYKKIPYIFHPFAVVKRALSYDEKLSISNDEFSAACILHDVIEDTNVTYEDIVKEFGIIVANIVLEVTNPVLKNFDEKYQHLKTFNTKSKEAIVLKIADRVCNVLDMQEEASQAWYGIRYALQAYPVFMAYINKDGTNQNIIRDITSIENLIHMRYNVSILTSSEKEIEKELGIKKE